MVKTCCVKNCDIGPKANITCFRFPNNRFLKRQWIDAIGLTNKLTANSMICIRHFQDDDYDIVRGRPRLKARVIPTVFTEMITSSPSHVDSDDDDLPLKETIDIIDNNENTQTNDNVSETSKHKDSKEVTNKNVQRKKAEIEIKCDDNRKDVQREVKDNNNENNDVGKENEASSCVNNDVEKSLKESSDDNINRTKEEKDKIKDHVNNTTESKSVDSIDKENSSINRVDSIAKPAITNADGIDKVNNSNDKIQSDINKDVGDSTKTKPNGVISSTAADLPLVKSAPQSTNTSIDDLNKDIEEILVNYQIKQTRPVHSIEETQENGEDGEEVQCCGEVPQTEPVFIEVSVQGKGDRAGSPHDCMMVLESVQVELDPRSFLTDGEHPDADCHETVDLDDDQPDNKNEKPPSIACHETVDLDDDQPDEKSQDPISLLTSSDEDEVIIQEPHIDTVEVSDETDEDDLPLVKLLKKKKKKKSKHLWGSFEYFCAKCPYSTTDAETYKSHAKIHSTILQVCHACDYTTASKTQFSRHKRKHKEDKKFKCHLCEYRARHNMSLIYHLKSHRALSSVKKGFKCDKCGYKSDIKSVLIRHVKLCGVKKHACDKCVYATNRPSDLRRHKARRHEEDLDADFVP